MMQLVMGSRKRLALLICPRGRLVFRFCFRLVLLALAALAASLSLEDWENFDRS
jgi:hypothetical protein